MDVLRPAWYAAYTRRTNRPITEATFAFAIADGLAEDIPTLERLGVRRFRTGDPESLGVSLGSQLRWYRHRAATS